MTTLTDTQFRIDAGNLSFTFLNSGDIFEISHQTTMVNQLLTNPIDGSLNNLYLRLHKENGMQVYPLLGIKSASNVCYSESQVTWDGIVENIKYTITFTLTEQGIWFWDVNVEGYNVDVDIIYGQDLGIADKGAVRTNEAYVSQYIDHTVFEDAQKGYVVCSRQNQPQQGNFPYMQQGALTKAIGFSTDGFQFFGLSYKETDEPEALKKEMLANEIYQYEFAYTALQSERVSLNGQAQFVFYGLFKENHPDAVSSPEFAEEIAAAWNSVQVISYKEMKSQEKVWISSRIGKPFQASSMTQEEINRFFPKRHQEEWDGNTLLSFFTDKHEHVILKEKEQYVERPHGHILMSGQNVQNIETVLTTTSYIYGVFNSQLVVGNTSFNKMLSNTRNALNIMKTAGQRIYIELDGALRLLTMPSMFELGFNYARWYYKANNELIIITNYTIVDSPEIHLTIQATSGKKYRYLVTNQVTMNGNEYETPFHVTETEDHFSFYADGAAMNASHYPNLSYHLKVTGAKVSMKDESLFATNIAPYAASLAVFEIHEASNWTMSIQGLLHEGHLPFAEREAEAEIERYRLFFKSVMNGFQLQQKGKPTEELEKVNALAWWYTHNMLVHYSVPHGLEQYGGAAWGTRDVCQGPTEYFMATQKYDTVREIIKTVYSHQFEDDGNWPQWFMFDKYFTIKAEESHGDIIVWPLKVVSDYLSVTNDFSILDEKVPYTRRSNHQFTEDVYPILSHIKKELAYIKDHFLHDTFLSSYGDGDWDDTLQPANAQLKQYIVSSWTVSLTYQVFNQLSKVLRRINEQDAIELETFAKGIQEDFSKYMLQSDVIPGFVYLEHPDNPELMLHPTDSKTGIDYRLLPMTRSMISELLTPEQAEDHYHIIKENLFCPDGVRLMNKPANYHGGVSSNFKRAEQAANFGREIGLQYVHAHIRYVEAMAKLGKVDEVWNGLLMINPIGIQEVVSNAERRQSNAYFSSSDGKFNTRYEADENFDKLRTGSVPVKGGWRIYSSGPGIYMNQLISNCLGIRQDNGNLVIDPVLPEKLNGLEFHYQYMNHSIVFSYHLQGHEVKKVLINGHPVSAETVSNRYRSGGLIISAQNLEKLLTDTTNKIEIFI
ncbi:cellobiose phosphorylase [Bacillus sp. SA1-12]|uniref:GH36-type glycosyl hydrolase domain-containing protein n=1 Tax=Bacillus sp. SA1-12 TaxID=1455638 RepID=UPI0006271B52|nr:glycosyl hydrolase family 65 protein [Bacillus sp. SA1-12]KKI89850.1 cellobiose phosphorylase [Bacillus sp. SA1-12]